MNKDNRTDSTLINSTLIFEEQAVKNLQVKEAEVKDSTVQQLSDKENFSLQNLQIAEGKASYKLDSLATDLHPINFDSTNDQPVSNEVPQQIVDQEANEDCAEYIIRYLETLGVEYVFGIPGGNIEPFYNALAKSARRGGIQYVVARHESGAVFMAEGYFRATGKLGVVCTTSGPGATNAITGIACAYGNYASILLITAQTGLANFGQGALQESSGSYGIDILAMLDSTTRFNALISHPKQITTVLNKAVMYAFGPTPGPVHLSIPRDIFGQNLPTKKPAIEQAFLLPASTLMPDMERLSRLTFLLSQAKQVAIVVGNYAHDCADLIIQVAEKYHWYYVVSPGAKGYLPSVHTWSAGVYGMSGHDQAQALLEHPDCEVILAIGLENNEVNTCGWKINTLNSNRLIQISDNFELLTGAIEAQLKIYATPRAVLQHLLSRTPEPGISHLTKAAGQAGFNFSYRNKPCLQVVKGDFIVSSSVKPQQLLEQLNASVSEKAPVVMEMGNSFLWGIHYWNFHHQPDAVANKNLFVIDNGMAAMGWAMGAAIGIAFAQPKQKVLCFCGDGAYLMAGQELTVAVQHQLNMIFVVLNDACLGTVKHGQIMAKAERIAYQLPRVDFAAMAIAQGAQGVSIKNMTELTGIAQWLDPQQGPIVIDVWIDDTECPPLKTRIDALNHA